MNPFFSIIVPCCDVAPYLRECLDSVVKQPFSDWECLLGVETSKDNTEKIACEYAARDSRFRVFTGPRSGSCSVSRNLGIDMATGEYIIFLDGDDAITDGSLQRIHDKIAARPGADLYPCAIQAHNDMTGKDEELRDNYPPDFDKELTGHGATLAISARLRHPEPMMQLTVCRRDFIVTHNLKCIPGISGQDREFSPRALYLARRVVPLHEKFYIYRKRSDSVMRAIDVRRKLHDEALIHKSLFSFHAQLCRSQSFDKRIATCWCRSWISWVFYTWFSPRRIASTPRAIRCETMGILFSDGFGDFNLLLKHASMSMRIAGWWFRTFAKTPCLRSAAEIFFKIYFSMSKNRAAKKCL